MVQPNATRSVDPDGGIIESPAQSKTIPDSTLSKNAKSKDINQIASASQFKEVNDWQMTISSHKSTNKEGSLI